MYLQLIPLVAVISLINSAPTTPLAQTTIKTEEVPHGSIEHKVLKKPHDLFIGRCKPNDNVLHQENIILYNDGKSHVAAGIRVNVQADVSITCAKIFVVNPAGEVVNYGSGGVGFNYLEFSVKPEYGKGFHVFVQIFGIENNTTFTSIAPVTEK